MKFLRYALLLLSMLAGALRPTMAQVAQGSGQSTSQPFAWAQLVHSLGRASLGFTQAATTDLAGNTYTSVRFRDSVRVGGVRFTATGPADVLVKFDSTGHVAWAKRMRGMVFDLGGLKVNPATGELFMSGQLLPGATWDGTPVPGGGAATYFYGKCSATGALLWVMPRPYIQRLMLAADNLGNCYFLGYGRAGQVGGVSIDSTALTVFRVDAAGAVQWVRKFRGVQAVGTAGGSLGLTSFYGIGPKPGGGAIVFGQFIISLFYHTGTTPVQTGSTQQLTNFVASVDAAGALQWSRPAPGQLMAATADAADNYYVTGSFPLPNTPAGYYPVGIGVAKYSSAGTQQWLRTQQPDTLGYEAGHEVAVDGVGNVNILADGLPAGYSVRPRPGTRLGNLLLNARSNVVRFNSQGQEQWVANGQEAGGNTGFLGGVALGLDGAGNVYYTTEIDGDSLYGKPVVLFGAQTVVGAGVAVTRINTRHNTVAGRIYLDQNGNGVRDAGEGPFPGTVAVTATQANGTLVATPNAAGSYELYPGTGPFTVQPTQVPLYYTVSQPASSSYSASFSTIGVLDSARHFGIRPLANQADVRVTLTPYGAARPGFTTRYRLTVENVGTTVASGTATATLDSRMAYISSTPTGSRSGQTVTWNYASLVPFARREFDVLFSLPTNTALGTVLTTTAAAPLAADVVPADNTATAAQTVTGSYDPNAIEVNYQRLTPAQVAAGQPLDYTIRFQNMGTDTAFTVVLSDTLDFRKLNVGSLQLVAQSHNCLWSLSGTGLLTVRFLNINLPYRNIDVIRSQGFVRFRVQPRPTLAVGEIIPNHARITFDYNAPVRTNTATTTVLLATATLARHDAPAWTAYPNPATDAVTLAADLASAGPVKIELLDALGRPVRHQTLAAPAGPLRQTVDLRGLAPGLYLLRLTPPTGPATSRPVVHE